MDKVKDAYDSAKQHSLVERGQLRTHALQLANNRLKDYLIASYVGIGSRVLDMGCGKGGDGRRILAQRPRRYIGFDLSGKSVQEAERRHGTGRYFQGSMTDPATFQHPLVTAAMPFDVLNTQFCLHYVWPEIDAVLDNVDKVCGLGCTWIGTLVDDGELGKFGAGNAIAQIKNKTGTEYVFSMPPLVVDVKEAIVPFRDFLEKIRIRGWQLLSTRLFRDMHFGRHLTGDLRDVHHLYRYFVLVKH